MSTGKNSTSPRANESIRPLIVIVTGPTCSGKTTLARALAERFALPLFHKDGFKEPMFDIALLAADAGTGAGINRDFSQLLGRFSLACLEVALLQCARSGIDAVFEANFDSHLFSPRLSAIRQRYPIRLLQAHLRYIGVGQDDSQREEALLVRFAARESADRHPGHGAWRRDRTSGRYGLPEGFGRTLVRLHQEDKPLEVEDGDDLMEVDTADFATADFEQVFQRVSLRLHKACRFDK